MATRVRGPAYDPDSSATLAADCGHELSRLLSGQTGARHDRPAEHPDAQ
ncbi:hypothetical protein [Nonomuraea jiangxiensis]|nr:hypothetical protein [Nonomuraea jiangxiensis]